ncbi:hypothetical protein HDV57DRAFT_434066 [Trichoderma longibrachiatum]
MPSGLCSMAFCRFSMTRSWRIISSILLWFSTLNGSSLSRSISRCRVSRSLRSRSWLSRNILRNCAGSSTDAASSGCCLDSCCLTAGSPRIWRRSISVSFAAPAAAAAAHVPDVDRQHVAIANLQLLHGFGIVRDESAVVVDVLRRGWNAGLGLDGLAQGRNGHVGEDVECHQAILVSSMRIEDVERDAPNKESFALAPTISLPQTAPSPARARRTCWVLFRP